MRALVNMLRSVGKGSVPTEEAIIIYIFQSHPEFRATNLKEVGLSIESCGFCRRRETGSGVTIETPDADPSQRLRPVTALTRISSRGRSDSEA